MLFENINIKDLLKKGYKIYYYNRWFYAHKRRQINPLEGKILLLNNTISDFRVILLLFDKIIFPIEHILSLIHKNEIIVLQKLFNNNFVKNLIENGLIIFSIWYTDELLSPEYFIEINKEYLTASGWSLKGDWYNPIPKFPINSEKLYVYKRQVSKQSKDFRNFYIQALEFLSETKQLKINKARLKEIEKAIENGEWTIKTTDAYIPFSMEKFYYDIQIKEEFKYWKKEEIKLSLELAKSAYYKAGETGNGGSIFLPLDLEDEIVVNRTTYNEEIYAFLLSPFFLKKIIISILDIDPFLLERITLEKLLLLRKEHCFKELQNFFICLIKKISELIKSENYIEAFPFLKEKIDKEELIKKILEVKNYIIYKIYKKGKILSLILYIINLLLKIMYNQDFSEIKKFIESGIPETGALQCYYDTEIIELNFKCLKYIKKILNRD